MRRRGAAADAPTPRPEPSPIKRKVNATLKKIDLYSNNRVAAEFTTAPPKESSRLAVASYWVMLVLFLSEFRIFLRTEERDHVVVDRSMGQQLRIRLNVTFPPDVRRGAFGCHGRRGRLPPLHGAARHQAG